MQNLSFSRKDPARSTKLPGKWMAAFLPLFAGIAFAQSSLDLTVVGTTPTQAVLQYTAPSTAACTVEASESPTYLPVVHDVDAILFPQANLDTRTGNLHSGQMRVVVIGKRSSETASDRNTYSRALQTNTQHYFRVNCNGLMAIATATTANIPAGATYNDGPQTDQDLPGQWKMPTRFEDRSQTTVDPQTGALLHQVSLDAESGRSSGYGYAGMFLTYGGFNRVCDTKMVGPANGPLGYICTFPRDGQMGNVAYWIVPSTGEVRILGNLPISAGGPWGPLHSDFSVFGTDSLGNTSRATYVGNFQESYVAALDNWMVYSSVPIGQMMHDFDSTFDSSVYSCPQPSAPAGKYVLFTCTSGGQDSPGWLGVLYGGDGRPIQPGCNAGDACPRIVAAMNVFAAAPTRYCGLHNVQQLENMASINVQLVANQPACAAFGHIIYWKFLNDPHGLDTTNTNVVVDYYFDGGGHWDYGPLGRITEYGPGWSAMFGNVPDHLNQPMSLTIDDSPSFAGARGLSYGSTTSKHPSYHQVAGLAPQSELGWFMDAMSFDGGQFYSSSSGATAISGQLYRWNPTSEAPPLARKQVPTLAVSGGYSLVDISGPGSALGDTSADSYKYCVALLAGECHAGSLPGEVYVNAPNIQYLNCRGGDGPNPQNLDICVGNLSTYSQAITQMVMGSDSADSNARSRVISHGLSGIRNSFYFWTAKSLPDASWSLFTRGVVAPPFGDLLTVWMAKLPPLAAPDGIDRSTFLPLTVNLTPPANSQIARAIIQFGYAEQGDAERYYCTSRREACVAATATFTAANPFQYAIAESYTGVPCVTSCKIAIPVLPMHVVYYQAVYLDASGHVVTTGTVGVSAEVAQASVTGGFSNTPVQTVLTTVPPGLTVSIDGINYTAPKVVSWTPGSKHTLAVASPQTNGGTRNTLTTWSTGASTPQITLQAPSTGTTVTATFATKYQLTAVTNPPGVGLVTGAGWYAAGSVVAVQATVPASYALAYFSGDLSGTANPQNVTMNGPKNVLANFQSTDPPLLNAAVTGKANGAITGQRVWTIRLANTGMGTATGARITAVTPSQSAGTLCTKAAKVVTAMPVTVGTIAPSANASGQVTLDFSGCTDSTVRFALKVGFTANGGTYSRSITINNQTK
jgi:Divergent InlB B-repeat domain